VCNVKARYLLFDVGNIGGLVVVVRTLGRIRRRIQLKGAGQRVGALADSKDGATHRHLGARGGHRQRGGVCGALLAADGGGRTHRAARGFDSGHGSGEEGERRALDEVGRLARVLPPHAARLWKKQNKIR
jgi:hypothetical protein